MTFIEIISNSVLKSRKKANILLLFKVNRFSVIQIVDDIPFYYTHKRAEEYKSYF